MKSLLSYSICIAILLLAGSLPVSGQTDPFNRDPRRDEDAKIIKDMLAKQQSEREKKEHEELLERANIAQKLSDDIEKAFEAHPSLSPEEEKKLIELEKVVKKIRDDLGGDDDDKDDTDASSNRDSLPKDVREAFITLRKTTLQLVDEVKKTTRFSISAAAIQSSNAVLRLVRFLRLKN